MFSGQPYLAEGARFIIEDLGIHILDISRALFGDVARISATTTRINPEIRGEDVATTAAVAIGIGSPQPPGGSRRAAGFGPGCASAELLLIEAGAEVLGQ